MAMNMAKTPRSMAEVKETIKSTISGETPYVLVDGNRIPTNLSEALFAYVSAPDSHYSYYDTKQTIAGDGWTGYVLNMTSQGWLSPSDSNRPVWTHTLVVVKPDTIANKTAAVLYITGGKNGDKPPTKDDLEFAIIAGVAKDAGVVTAVLYQVPNQPIEFFDDPLHKKGRTEDAAVAYTWKHVADNPLRPDWAMYLPMTKSAIRAMDTVSDFCVKSGFAYADKWYVLGASKRGATTWLVGAYDGWLPPSRRRLLGIAPIVFDMLNLPVNVPHMYRSYGGWTFAFTDYRDNNITSLIGTPKMYDLATVVDPYSYRKYLTMPKLVITATGDEFFMPDDNWYWFGDIPGETNLLMIENAEHSMITGFKKLIEGALGFLSFLMTGTPRPITTWKIDNSTGQITLKTSDQPDYVLLHSFKSIANTPNRRDFRMIKGYFPPDVPCPSPAFVVSDKCVNPIAYNTATVQPAGQEDGFTVYRTDLPVPTDGNWLGFYFETQRRAPSGHYMITSTQVSIIPNTYPFQACGTGDECHGTLV